MFLFEGGRGTLPPFRIWLDRSGTTQEAISAAIQQAVDALRAVDQAQAVDTLEPDGLHTEFRYHLRDQRSREVARMGMEDLRRALPCILLFSQRLGEVQLVVEAEGRRETVTFRRGPAEELSDRLLRQKTMEGRRMQTWYVLQREGISLAAAWDKHQGFLPLPADSPPAVYRLSPGRFRTVSLPGGAEQLAAAA